MGTFPAQTFFSEHQIQRGARKGQKKDQEYPGQSRSHRQSHHDDTQGYADNEHGMHNNDQAGPGKQNFHFFPKHRIFDGN